MSVDDWICLVGKMLSVRRKPRQKTAPYGDKDQLQFHDQHSNILRFYFFVEITIFRKGELFKETSTGPP